MTKLQLFARIQKLATIVHSRDVIEFNFPDNCLQDMQKTLSDLTEQYISLYCEN